MLKFRVNASLRGHRRYKKIYLFFSHRRLMVQMLSSICVMGFSVLNIESLLSSKSECILVQLLLGYRISEHKFIVSVDVDYLQHCFL